MAAHKVTYPRRGADGRCDILGTVWVPPGEGSTWRELFNAFGWPTHNPASKQYYPRPGLSEDALDAALGKRTNLLLPGGSLTQIDQARWESGNVR